jgi:hypothetical protein
LQLVLLPLGRFAAIIQLKHLLFGTDGLRGENAQHPEKPLTDIFLFISDFQTLDNLAFVL